MSMNTQRGFAFIPLLIGAAVLVSGAFFGPTTVARYHADQAERLLSAGKLEQSRQEFEKARKNADFFNLKDKGDYFRKTQEVGAIITDRENEQKYQQAMSQASHGDSSSINWDKIYATLRDLPTTYTDNKYAQEVLIRAKREVDKKTTVNTKKSSNVAGATTQRPVPPQGNKIECIGPDGVHFWTTQKECDDFNNAWKNNKPEQENRPPSDQGQNNRINIPSYTNTYVDNSITCFVSYPCTGASFTYRMLPSDCTNAQQSASNICDTSKNNYSTPIATPTLTDSQAQSIIDQHNSQVKQCQSNVVYQYSGLIQSCTQYGGSAGEACKNIYEKQRQDAYNACGATY